MMNAMGRCVRIAVLVASFTCIGATWAATVYVAALGYGRADVRINGSEVRAMWVGETTLEGVTLRSVTDDAAVFEIGGKVWTLKPGQGTYAQAKLQADAHGQFFVTAQVNGTPLPAIIDTGATAVVMNSEDAYRLGIDYMRGRRVVAQTASGPSNAYLVTFPSVQVGDIVLSEVPGSVIDVSRRELPLVLIGMSFLRNVDMRRSGDTMLLQRRDY
jgi:aspartyl protease family protein